MKIRLNRRRFLGLSSLLLGGASLPVLGHNRNYQSSFKDSGSVPMIHATDLYHTHGDPDDHYDLASIYALACSGNIDLKGILIDFPPKRRQGDPDVMGVSQLNYITGLVIPAIVGSPYLMNGRNDIQNHANRIEHQGIKWVIDVLKQSSSPVIINIVGAATDIAVAAKKEPALFEEKCKAIYLNAGSANTGKENKLEFNVRLNPNAYAAIFDVPCPVYWLPCWNETEKHEVGEYGSYYRFLQDDILPFLPNKVQNFFTFMLGQKKSHKWLEYLMKNEPDQELLIEYTSRYRNMWCTAGFLHAVGKKITEDGEIVTMDSEQKSIFSFLPVNVTCDDHGYTNWNLAHNSKNRFVFHVNDLTNYQKAMTVALKNLLLQLPKL